MKGNANRWTRPAAFTLAGGALGLAYYSFFGCTTGCAITSSPMMTALYGGLIGYLVSDIAGHKEKEA